MTQTTRERLARNFRKQAEWRMKLFGRFWEEKRHADAAEANALVAAYIESLMDDDPRLLIIEDANLWTDKPWPVYPSEKAERFAKACGYWHPIEDEEDARRWFEVLIHRVQEAVLDGMPARSTT